MSYRLTADVWVPNFRVKSYLRRLEGIGIRDLNVDLVSTTGIWRVGRCGKGSLEVRDVGLVDGLGKDTRIVVVGLDVSELLRDATISAGGHGGM